MFGKQVTVAQSSAKLCFMLETCFFHYVILVIVSTEAFCHFHGFKCRYPYWSSRYRICSWCIRRTVGPVLFLYF